MTMRGLTALLAEPAGNFTTMEQEERVISGLPLKLTVPEAAAAPPGVTAPAPGNPQAAAAHPMVTPVRVAPTQQQPGSALIKRGR